MKHDWSRMTHDAWYDSEDACWDAWTLLLQDPKTYVIEERGEQLVHRWGGVKKVNRTGNHDRGCNEVNQLSWIVCLAILQIGLCTNARHVLRLYSRALHANNMFYCHRQCPYTSKCPSNLGQVNYALESEGPRSIAHTRRIARSLPQSIAVHRSIGLQSVFSCH